MQDNENAPVTRADLHAMEKRIVALIGDVEARIEHVEARIEVPIRHVVVPIGQLEARIEHLETALLTEFHKWASPREMRIHTHSAVLRALDT